MHQRPPPAAPPHPHVPSLPPGQRYGHEPQHRAMSIPYQGLNGRGPIGFPPPVHYSNGGGPPGGYGGGPAPAPAPGRYDPRLPRASSLARNGPYGGRGRGRGRNGVGRPPPPAQRNTGPNPGPGRRRQVYLRGLLILKEGMHQYLHRRREVGSLMTEAAERGQG
ncbi:hypothetical protein VNI00_017732 [Paramarasmius palmivorus]|uniref:Uncharacterized protein n=1 Tax=Paramarasmius palmivorus TaxID=297713 RepID=A0AAW0B4Z0_9AGAR